MAAVYCDREGGLWLDTGNGELVALDEAMCRRLRDKWILCGISDVAEEFGPLTLLALGSTPAAVEYGIAWRHNSSVVHGWTNWRKYPVPDDAKRAEELAAFNNDANFEAKEVWRTAAVSAGEWCDVTPSSPGKMPQVNYEAAFFALLKSVEAIAGHEAAKQLAGAAIAGASQPAPPGEAS